MKKSVLIRKFTKKFVASVVSLSMVFVLSGSVFGASHAKNGSDIMPSKGTWSVFSVRDDLNYEPPSEEKTDWEKSIEKDIQKALKKAEEDYKAGKITQETYEARVEEIKGWESKTQAIMYMPNNHGEVTIKCYNTGFDGDYDTNINKGKRVLVADNPWAIKLSMNDIPVEYGRYYTMEFDISSNIEAKDPITGQKLRTDKYCLVKAYDYQTKGELAAEYTSFKVNDKEASKDGKFKIAKTPKDEEAVNTHITATFKIPDSAQEWSDGHDKGMFTKMGIKFALGAFAKTHENDVAQHPGDKEIELSELKNKGSVSVTNFKVIAGTQYAVKYFVDSSQKDLRYVNENGKAKYIALKKKGHTQTGFIDMATGAKFNFSTSIKKDINLKSTWTKTKKPKKASFKAKSKKKKKITIKFKKNTNAKGYQIKYSYNKKFKKKSKYKTKTKNTYNTTSYTIKKLKSSRVTYVKARAFNKDSCGYKVYGKWSKRKSVYVR